MLGRKMCSICETGKKALELDEREPVCPYLWCKQGNRCTWFKRIKDDNNHKKYTLKK